jgi:sporulation protein YlmC with PRC-barrel domain
MEMVQRASDIIGMSVLDSQDHTAGTVRDLCIDLRDGRIAAVIVDTTGATPTTGFYPETSIGAVPREKLAAVPAALVTCNPNGKTLRINIQPQLWMNAPRFGGAQIEEAASSPVMEGVYKYYAVQLPTFGSLERATRVLGDTVINDQDKRLGKVDNLVVDLPAGKVDKVILASGGFLGVDRYLTAIDPQSFVYEPDISRLKLDMSPESLKNSPHFKAGEWRSSLSTESSYTSSEPPEDK